MQWRIRARGASRRRRRQPPTATRSCAPPSPLTKSHPVTCREAPPHAPHLKRQPSKPLGLHCARVPHVRAFQRNLTDREDGKHLHTCIGRSTAFVTPPSAAQSFAKLAGLGAKARFLRGQQKFWLEKVSVSYVRRVPCIEACRCASRACRISAPTDSYSPLARTDIMMALHHHSVSVISINSQMVVRGCEIQAGHPRRTNCAAAAGACFPTLPHLGRFAPPFRARHAESSCWPAPSAALCFCRVYNKRPGLGRQSHLSDTS